MPVLGLDTVEHDAEHPPCHRLQTVQRACQLVALDQYAKLYPQSDKTIGVIYQAGYLFYNKNMFKEASERFRTVIAMNPKSKDAMTAANLILDSLNLIEDWSTLKEVAKAFYDQPNLGDTAFKKELYSVYERSSFKLIEETYKKDSDQAKATTSSPPLRSAISRSTTPPPTSTTSSSAPRPCRPASC